MYGGKKLKNILILGVGRAGKTTLSKRIREKYSKYNLVHADSIRNAILSNLDEKYIEDFMDYQSNEFFQKVLLDFIDDQTKQGLGKYGTILDGAQILPSVLSRYKNLNNTIVVYLGHGNIREDEIFQFIREFDKETDWTYSKTDEELRKEIEWFDKKNQFLLKECEKYGFKYIDTHDNRKEVLEEVFNDICRQIESQSSQFLNC